MKKLKYFLLIVLLLGSNLPASGIPKLQGRVNDYAGIINSVQKNTLVTMLNNLEEQTASQVVLLTVKSLEGKPLEEFSLQVVENWKLGQKGLDNGVLVLIAMKEKKVRIEVGYGLESILTDAKCSYIIRNDIVRLFKQGHFYTGIHKGLKTISGIISKDFDISPEELERFRKKSRKKKSGNIPVGLIIFLIIIAMNFFRGSGGRKGGRSSTMFFGGGFGGGGGFSGGGFSGGGGSFGGGGSSGGW